MKTRKNYRWPTWHVAVDQEPLPAKPLWVRGWAQSGPRVTQDASWRWVFGSEAWAHQVAAILVEQYGWRACVEPMNGNGEH